MLATPIPGPDGPNPDLASARVSERSSPEASPVSSDGLDTPMQRVAGEATFIPKLGSKPAHTHAECRAFIARINEQLESARTEHEHYARAAESLSEYQPYRDYAWVGIQKLLSKRNAAEEIMRGIEAEALTEEDREILRADIRAWEDGGLPQREAQSRALIAVNQRWLRHHQRLLVLQNGRDLRASPDGRPVYLSEDAALEDLDKRDLGHDWDREVNREIENAKVIAGLGRKRRRELVEMRKIRVLEEKRGPFVWELLGCVSKRRASVLGTRPRERGCRTNTRTRGSRRASRSAGGGDPPGSDEPGEHSRRSALVGISAGGAR
jgi:hypothetical protein